MDGVLNDWGSFASISEMTTNLGFWCCLRFTMIQKPHKSLKNQIFDVSISSFFGFSFVCGSQRTSWNRCWSSRPLYFFYRFTMCWRGVIAKITKSNNFFIELILHMCLLDVLDWQSFNRISTIQSLSSKESKKSARRKNLKISHFTKKELVDFHPFLSFFFQNQTRVLVLIFLGETQSSPLLLRNLSRKWKSNNCIKW